MFAHSILAGLAFAVAAVAQSSGRLAFTTFPTINGVTVGQPFTLRWQGGDGSPVTITLREGDMKNLNTIAVITGDATGTSYTWTPSASLPAANDYALEISQGTAEPNYSGEFPILGGPAASSSSISVSTITQSSASSVLSTITIAQSTQTSTIVTILSSSVANATITLSGTATLSGTGSVGTGGPSVSRNTTFSSQTLSTGSATLVTVGPSSTEAAATTTTEGATSSGSSTAGAAASSSTSSGAGVVRGSVGLVLAGIMGFALFC